MNKEKEKIIRAIVSGYVEGYAAGFSDRNSGKRDKSNLIDSVDKDFWYNLELSHFFNINLNSLLERIAIKLASLNYDTHEHKEFALFIKNQNSIFVDSYALLNNKWLWNIVCKSKFGYDIVVDEFKKSYGYLKQAFKK